ncbi:MAG: HGGxSTG domain-containing protein [Xanthobacteraceae bacterium]
MINDPMRQADIQRRLLNMAKAPRCGAKTRAGGQCRQAAVRGRSRCRMHGAPEARAVRGASGMAILRTGSGCERTLKIAKG